MHLVWETVWIIFLCLRLCFAACGYVLQCDFMMWASVASSSIVLRQFGLEHLRGMVKSAMKMSCINKRVKRWCVHQRELWEMRWGHAHVWDVWDTHRCILEGIGQFDTVSHLCAWIVTLEIIFLDTVLRGNLLYLFTVIGKLVSMGQLHQRGLNQSYSSNRTAPIISAYF